MIVENRIVRNFRCALLATLGIMSVMLFIWCFDSLLAPYPMNSFFVLFFQNCPKYCSLQYSYGLSNPYRATNVGFGITYTLPILIAILSAPAGTLLLLENPEAHLHPQGQAMMGNLLALAANCGVQVVLETHSDHVLNGVRLAVHGGKIKPEDVCLHFFQRIEQNDQASTQVSSPRIDRNGRIDQWPDGFFDEWDKSLDSLLEPAQR